VHWRFVTNRNGTERSQPFVVAGNTALGESRDRFQGADAVTELEHAVVVFPLLMRRRFFGESPALSDLPIFNPVQVDIEARFALMRALGSYKNEVILSQHEFDLVDSSVLNEFIQIAPEIRDSIADARLVADAMIPSKVVWNVTVIPRDMNGLVVFPDEQLVLVSVLRHHPLSWAVDLGVPALIGRGTFC
jgi:hypothetical protein